ncbi:16S rRNA (uracil(1498)-N(3))-methyltransferase [Nesterenkonia flava]|uniref:Ribosomal RNA small subunit methyltransferase E n=1 Tax=Nesterenkonia flava TaxID=469799 RepID=A0ABU1FPV2_9MICC|nr:16S rRNA (uracil(1498)-N(3))-methyltransferase [Nesterenkonia flava]MDR5710663.1 16S rRNA (uracil(1498)-N(3))-methyltransferase [Nesterenkonia flava]
MTAPLFHLTPDALQEAAVGQTVVLDGAEGHHAATVMRLGVGEQVLLSDTRTRRVAGVVVETGSGALTVEVREVHDESEPLPRLVLVQALAKDRRDLQAVESATELGVHAVIPWQAERSVARWKQGREAKKHAEWVNIAVTAAKQTRRTSIPDVRSLHTTAQYAAAVREDSRVVVITLHEVETTSFRKAVEQAAAQEGIHELHLVVGPEGGISERELGLLREAGASSARLGPNVLRSSTAGPAALATAQLLLGRWDSGVN